MAAIENPALMAGAFMSGIAPSQRRSGSLQDRIQMATGRERGALDSSARVTDFETAVAERVANKVHELNKIEKVIGIRPEASKPFEDDEVTQFYVDELKKLVGDVGTMSRDMLGVQLKRMKGLMEDLSSSSSEEQEFLSQQYAQSLTFLQNEYKARSNIMSRTMSKMGDLAEQYMDVRSMYAGFVDDNPIAMALFRVAGDALKSHRDNKKAQKELIAADKHRSFMAEKTEEDKHELLMREQARAEELAAMDADKEEAQQVEPVVEEPVISREEKVESDAAERMEKVDEGTDDRLNTEFQRESIERDDRLFEKVSDIHDLIETGKEESESKEDEAGGGLLAGLGKKFGNVVKMAAPLLTMLAPLMKLGLVGLAGAAGYAAGTWIYEEFIAGTAFSEWLGESIYNIVEGVKSLWTDLTGFFDNFSENMLAVGDMISATVDNAFEGISNMYTDLTEWIGEKIQQVKDLFPSFDDAKEAGGAALDWISGKLGFDDASKSDEIAAKVAEETARRNNTIGMTGKVAPSNMVAANEVADAILQKQSEQVAVQNEQLVNANMLYAASNKANLDAPVQKSQEQKIKMIEQQVAEIDAEKQRLHVAVVGNNNLTGKSQKKSVQGVSGTPSVTPLTSARNPDSSVARNTDKYYGRGMG
jgi:hypothetical protein